MISTVIRKAQEYLTFLQYRIITFNRTYHLYTDTQPVKNPRVDLVTVAFNNPTVIRWQTHFLRQNLIDPFTYTVFDNSTEPTKQAEIIALCKTEKIPYVALPKNRRGLGPSTSHGLALTWIYNQYLKPRRSTYIGFLDHDIFPIQKTSLIKILNKSPVYGWPQTRDEKWYLWAGFSFFHRDILQNKTIDFLPRFGLDTGGGNWPSVYQERSVTDLPKVSHHYGRLLPRGTKKTHSVYEEITEKEAKAHPDMIATLVKDDHLIEFMDTWLHTFNASNWRQTTDKNQYIESLLKTYER